MALRTLLQFAHPALERSRVNVRLLAAVERALGEQVVYNDLYERYPSQAIDVAAEQALLSEHELIVLQFPFYWYSVPGLLKDWMDLVLQHGWAYGEGGTRLAGKRLLLVTTTGGPAAAYAQSGKNRFTMRQLLAPLEQTAYLCRMHFLPPLVFHDSLSLSSDRDIEPLAHDYLLALAEARREDLELAWCGRYATMHHWLERPEHERAR